MGLSTYMVCIDGESKPVSHMSRTITSSSSSSGFLARSFSSRRACLLRTWRANSGPSAAEPVITTLIFPAASSSACQSGRSFTMASYRSTQIRRLMHTINALPASTLRRFSQCSTMSAATSPTRLLAPTIASTRAQRVLSRSRVSTSASSVTSSKAESRAP
jgi:hypothetical protein